MSFYAKYHHSRGRSLHNERPSNEPLQYPDWYDQASSKLYKQKWTSRVQVDAKGNFSSTYKYDIVTDPLYVAWSNEYGRGSNPETFKKTRWYNDSQLIRSQGFHDWAMKQTSSRGRQKQFIVEQYVQAYKVSPEYRNLKPEDTDKPSAPAPAEPKPAFKAQRELRPSVAMGVG